MSEQHDFDSVQNVEENIRMVSEWRRDGETFKSVELSWLENTLIQLRYHMLQKQQPVQRVNTKEQLALLKQCQEAFCALYNTAGANTTGERLEEWQRAALLLKDWLLQVLVQEGREYDKNNT